MRSGKAPRSAPGRPPRPAGRHVRPLVVEKERLNF